MHNNKFIKIFTIFVSLAFILEMVPLEALALCGGPSAMSSWNKCQWAIEPKGQELAAPSTKEIRFPNSQETSWCSTDTHGETYSMQFPAISWSKDSRSWPNWKTLFPNDLNFLQWVSVSPQISFSQKKVSETTATYYKLKTSWRGRISDKAQTELYPGRKGGTNTCCPDGDPDQCKTGTVKECLVNYCQTNSTDCSSYQVTTPTYQYTKTIIEGPNTFHGSKITKLPEVTEEQKAVCNPIFETYKTATGIQKDALRQQLFSNGCGLEAEHTIRTTPQTTATTTGEIVACGTKERSWGNIRGWGESDEESTRVCPSGGESINGESSLVLADGTTKTIKEEFGEGGLFGTGGWSDYKFVPSSQPTVTQIGEASSVSNLMQVVTPDEVVASVTWQASGKDCDGGIIEECKKYAGVRGMYLTADGTAWDGHAYKSATYGGGALAILGFLVGWAVNIILPGSGFIIMGGVTWGDVIFVGALLAPGGGASITLPSGLSMVNCNLTSLPLGVSQAKISTQPNCDNQGVVSIGLSIVPDSTKTGKVTGYELFRQIEGGTTQTSIKKQENLSVEQSQSAISYTDTTGLQKDKNYLYSVSLIVASGTKTLTTATVKTTCSSTCAFSASPSTIIKPAKSTLSWSCANISNCSISPSVGNVSQSGSTPVQPDKTTTYTLICNNGQVSKTTTVTVLKPGYCEINPSGDGCQ